MKTELIMSKGVALINTICIAIITTDLKTVTSVLAFIIIFVSNWSRFSTQIKAWFKKLKK